MGLPFLWTGSPTDLLTKYNLLENDSALTKTAGQNRNDSLKGYVHQGFSVLQDAREHSEHDPMWLTFGSAEFRETSANNALYLPFLGPVMPLLFYIGLGMIEDLADFPNQFLGFQNSQILIEGQESRIYALSP